MFTPSEIELRIGSKTYTRAKSWNADADMYLAAAAFDITLAPTAWDAAAGQAAQLSINNQVVLSGIVDSVERNRDKPGGSSVTVSGRDLMGLVVDHYATSFVSLAGRTLKAIAESLLADVPFISRKGIQYRDGAESLAPALRSLQVEPGQRVFDILQAAAASRGLMFYCLPDGTFVFGKPIGRARAGSHPPYHLMYHTGSNDSRIETASYVHDIADQHSKIIVVGQQQGYDDVSAASINVMAQRSVSTFPYYKPYVDIMNEDVESPARRARALQEQQQLRARRLTYTVGGHDQNGTLWTIDELCRVEDDDFDIIETMLVTGRKLMFTKDGGSTTEVRLSTPGIVGSV